MIYTNKFELPDAFYRAVVNDKYSKGESDFSITELINPPRAGALIERFKDEIEIDVSSRVDAILGQGTHSILERAARPQDVIERRFFGDFTVDGKKYVVSAQIDYYSYDTFTLSDWKTTKAYAFSGKLGMKEEWVVQMNGGAELMRRAGFHIEKLEIIGLLKDWSPAKARESGYPKAAVVSKPIPLWKPEEINAWIEERIRRRVRARILLPDCSTEETWRGNRCERWCDASSKCETYKQALKTGLMKG